MSESDGRFVLVGQIDEKMKAFGPFESADDAMEFCNAVGVPHARWQVLPLQGTGGD